MTLLARAMTAVAIVAAGGVSEVALRSGAVGADAPVSAGLVEGTPGIQSAGALAFGPGGVLFLGDSRGGAVFALAIDDRVPDAHRGDVEVHDIDKRIATLLGTTPDQVVIRDMAVNPATQHMFFSVSRGRGTDATPALVRATLTGELTSIPSSVNGCGP